MHGFIQRIQKICYEQARCDVKKIRRDMVVQVNGMLTGKCASLEKDIGLLRPIPEWTQALQDGNWIII